MDFAVHEMDFAAQAHWHHFRYRIGELIGLDRNKREVELAPYLDNEGGEVAGRRLFRYDTLIIAIGSHGNDFGTRVFASMRSCWTPRTRPNASMSGCSIPCSVRRRNPNCSNPNK
jgi:NADH dehydrogenase FAD-containing subunit